MVTMEMRDKDSIDFSEVQSSTTHLHLRALSAIYHEGLASQFHDLRGGVMFKGGQCTATPQYMNFEWFQLILVLFKWFQWILVLNICRFTLDA